MYNLFIVSVRGILWVNVGSKLNRIVIRLATKWKETYSRTCRYIKSIVAITLVWAAYRCIRRAKVTAYRISVQNPQWEDGAGLNLFR